MTEISASSRKKKLFSARLNQTLDILEYPPLHLGRIERLKDVFQVSQTAARKWITGLSLPHYERRKVIARQLGVRFDWLEQGEGQMFDTLEEPSILTYPILNLKNLKHYPHKIAQVKESLSCPASMWRPRGFVLVQSFKEMAERFPLGCFLLVDPEEQIQDQAFVIIRLAKNDQILFRQIKMTVQGHFVCACDPEIPPFLISSSDKVIGRVVQVIINF